MKEQSRKNIAEGMKESWKRRKAAGIQIVTRGKSRKKGKWSKLARAKHSVRMKERFAAKQTNAKSVVAINKLSIKERLNIIEHHVNSIRQQLGG
jgi:phage tail tube protein FII